MTVTHGGGGTPRVLEGLFTGGGGVVGDGGGSSGPCLGAPPPPPPHHDPYKYSAMDPFGCAYTDGECTTL